jgi:alpha-L-fucosidase
MTSPWKILLRRVKRLFSPPIEIKLDIPVIPIPEDKLVLPTIEQVKYHQLELIGFLHFTVNTFTDKEWGYGDEDPKTFNPTALDAKQWVKAAKMGGMKELILTVKHHDGFCLWPSKYTCHSVKNSPYKNGHGDIVREFVDACREHGMKPGFYLSPWDRNHPDYGKPAYVTYYRNQLTELLAEYGEIHELWFDGANGGDGYYGGAREKRTINRDEYYDWPFTFHMIKQMQPGIIIFSNVGTDARWVGNESGKAEETCWSPILSKKLLMGDPNPPTGRDLAIMFKYWFTGESGGDAWLVPQADVSIRPGWFYHQSEDGRVKSAQALMNLYYASVGRNAVLLVNIPPDRRGLLPEQDIANLQEFKSIMEETFRTNLAAGATVTGEYQGDHVPSNIVDSDPLETYWKAPDNSGPKSLEISLPHAVTFNRILLQEPIQLGQRIAAFTISAHLDGQWKSITKETTTTIGYKRLLKTKCPVTAQKVRIDVLNAVAVPCLSNFGLYLASPREI